MPNRYMAYAHAVMPGAEQIPTTTACRRLTFNPNRRVRYDNVTFHHKRVTLKTRNNKLNSIPGVLVVRGGGRRTYNTDVAKNQVTVGTSVYAHASKIDNSSARLPNNLPTNAMLSAAQSAPLTAPMASAINCCVKRNGRNAAIFTALARAKYKDSNKPI